MRCVVTTEEIARLQAQLEAQGGSGDFDEDDLGADAEDEIEYVTKQEVHHSRNEML